MLPENKQVLILNQREVEALPGSGFIPYAFGEQFIIATEEAIIEAKRRVSELKHPRNIVVDEAYKLTRTAEMLYDLFAEGWKPRV
jgi:hypothetical protein